MATRAAPGRARAGDLERPADRRALAGQPASGRGRHAPGLRLSAALGARFWRQLVLALYHSKRQAEALAAYNRARTLLSESFGLDPSEELRALERAVLRQELVPAASAVERHNLPAPLTSFVGREHEL